MSEAPLRAPLPPSAPLRSADVLGTEDGRMSEAPLRASLPPQVEQIDVALARLDELDEVDALITEAYAHDYGPSDHGDAMQFSRVRAERFDVWVARDAAGTLLGSVTTRRRGGPSLHEDVRDDELDLRLLGVSPAARRRGVGARIMRRVAEHAAQQGFGAVFLKTAPNMRGAHRLYEALGFERVRERDGLWIGGERVLDLFSYRYSLRAEIEARHRRVLGSFPSGVVVLAADEAAVTVQSFISLSLDPPLIALSIGRSSSSWPRIAAAGSFAVTVLAEHQGELARLVSKPAERKLDGIPVLASAEHGHPIIEGGVAWLECSVRAVHDGGDHHLVVADVLDLGLLDGERQPLLFAGSRFGRLAREPGGGERSR